MGLVLVGLRLREAGAGGSNPPTPTIYSSNYAILVDHCLLTIFSEIKLG